MKKTSIILAAIFSIFMFSCENIKHEKTQIKFENTEVLESQQIDSSHKKGTDLRTLPFYKERRDLIESYFSAIDSIVNIIDYPSATEIVNFIKQNHAVYYPFADCTVRGDKTKKIHFVALLKNGPCIEDKEGYSNSVMTITAKFIGESNLILLTEECPTSFTRGLIGLHEFKHAYYWNISHGSYDMNNLELLGVDEVEAYEFQSIICDKLTNGKYRKLLEKRALEINSSEIFFKNGFISFKPNFGSSAYFDQICDLFGIKIEKEKNILKTIFLFQSYFVALDSNPKVKHKVESKCNFYNAFKSKIMKM